MPYVVTQPCCADASCVTACPVNCIHPAPGEPGFGNAEMLFIDARSCVDCGACTTACPVGAIKPHTKLTDEEQVFAELAADFYDLFPHPERTPLALVPPSPKPARPERLRVAIVGAGPAGLFSADELLRRPGVTVNVLDRLATPHGLVRGGVAPDHQHTKGVTRLFEAIESQPGFAYLLGVEVGTDVTPAELSERYDAVVYAVGAATGRTLDLPGADLPGSVTAAEVVGWWNGHPDHADLDVPLGHEHVVVVGNGNVALDVARVLTADPDDLQHTDIATLPLVALGRSAVRTVTVLGRRGPAEAAFTLPELVGLSALPGVDVLVEHPVPITPTNPKLRLLAELQSRTPTPGRRRIVLRFDTTPARVVGTERSHGLEVIGGEVLPAGLVIAAIGHRCAGVPGLSTGTIPHEDGRVLGEDGRPLLGHYVVGWAKRGPQGFIGTNRSCAAETVRAILEDAEVGLLVATSEKQGVADLLAARGVRPLDLAAWRRLDAEELRRGERWGRPRVKIVDRDEQGAIARARRTTRRGLRARLTRPSFRPSISTGTARDGR